MNQNEWMKNIFSAMVNQSIINQQKGIAPLPEDQQEAKKKILEAIHDLMENKQKIKPEYQSQVFDAVILKIAAELGWLNGGNL
ncbi:hypothetical protein [uncultured Oscillibacter sp.]|uniref:hypothetical protein n=1 Tax=uncultured Oscillibacter sp. TaxID=876091 RepID=UPI00262348BC|nr:hypothetical protein [uncultured Oscillibacter sp.]